ncbi:hypothetical protein A3Q56_00494 [Intoshia linei]|uniref:Uncharacterized protein n=1 Tax=Intoshia linei TaxID=1819745 RepID=A0A177BC22_9BILA|nr:hypothetical protein A3Q56_00494 [Intoshia linei]
MDSWIKNFADKAEEFLVKVDTSAFIAFNEEEVTVEPDLQKVVNDDPEKVNITKYNVKGTYKTIYRSKSLT